MGGGQIYISDTLSFAENKHSDSYHPVGFTLPGVSGFISAIGYGDEAYDWLIMPSEANGSSELPVGDYSWNNTNLNGYRILRLYGAWNDSVSAGAFDTRCNDVAGQTGRNIGCRLLYVPTASVRSAIS